MKEHSREYDRPDGMKLVFEVGDNSEIPSATSQRPKQVCILAGACFEELAVGGHYVGREQIVAGEPVLTAQPADAAAQREPRDSGV
jgi:hypothetical protein